MNHQDLLDQAIQRIALAPKPIQAIEAFWDGDPSGWFLVMVALMAREGPDQTQGSPPYIEHQLLVLQGDGGDLRLFNGIQMPWTECAAAMAVGGALAERYRIPFYFPASDWPDDETPRWWQQHLAIPCRACGKAILPPASPYRLADLCYPCELKARFGA